MTKKSKMKISKVKRNNQTTNKMKKQGKLKLQRHRTKVQKQRPSAQPRVDYSSASDSESGEEWADMLDEDEQKYILSRLSKQPQLLSNVPEEEPKMAKSSRKRKRDAKEKGKPVNKNLSDSGAESVSGAESDSAESDLEEKYEQEKAQGTKRTRDLLPIKTKSGLMPRAEEYSDSESEQEEPMAKQKKMEDDETHESDSGMEGTEEEPIEGDNQVEIAEVTAVELLAARRDRLAHDKLRIGALCSSLLESPEKKLKNLYPVLYLMEERLKDGTLNLMSIRKLATLSAAEVFRDILPEYLIRHQDYSNVKLKKDTLALYKYEKELLEFYKRYLQRLEKLAMLLRQKKGDTRKIDEATISLAFVSLRCMCSLLVARPHFNYATNIAQSVLPYLACKEVEARNTVTDCCVQVFKDDSKGDITLTYAHSHFNYATNIAQSVLPYLACKEVEARNAVTDCCVQVFKDDSEGDITLTIVRLIHQLVRKRGDRLHPSALDCLLTLKIRDVDMDAEAEIQQKKRVEEKRKKRIVNLSKKEKKRAKKLKEVEKELLETEAQESEMARRKQLTEVTRTVFHIYFRLLKTAPHSRLLSAALTGIAKFTHVINMEFYSDLVAILRQLLGSERVGSREKLLVVRAVLAVLAGAGDALNVDPAVFHAYLYAHATDVHAGRTAEDAKLVIEAVQHICARARRVSSSVLCAFAKRLATLATQLPHNGAIACLALLNQLAQQSKSVAGMLEIDPEAGSGRFDPLLPSPEHCHAESATLFELKALLTHYHPTVRDAAKALLDNKPMPDWGKLSPAQLFDEYDGSKMAFKPAVPPPKKSSGLSKQKPHHIWSQSDLKEQCEVIENNVTMLVNKR